MSAFAECGPAAGAAAGGGAGGGGVDGGGGAGAATVTVLVGVGADGGVLLHAARDTATTTDRGHINNVLATQETVEPGGAQSGPLRSTGRL
jgi:hypothetical protein